MIILTNNASSTINSGQSLTFNNVILHTGCAECFHNGSGAVTLRMPKAIYEINFSADIGATAEGTAQLAIALNGSPMVETTMTSTTAAAGDLNNVAKTTAVQTCCCAPENIMIVNTGDTSVNISNPVLFVKRIA